MSVIEGSSVSVKTMSDGTLRLSVDIEPRNAQAAFALFGAPGRAVALAALKDGAGAAGSLQESPTCTNSQTAEKPKGGEWAKLAGMWCTDTEFWAFCKAQFEEDVSNPETAALFMRELIGIASRAELDHDQAALRRFNQHIRHPFMKWMQARGIVR